MATDLESLEEGREIYAVSGGPGGAPEAPEAQNGRVFHQLNKVFMRCGDFSQVVGDMCSAFQRRFCGDD